MEIMGYTFGIFGFVAFVLTLDNMSRISKIQRAMRNENSGSRMAENMKDILSGYIGKNINLDFYEDEESMDMLDQGKHTMFTLIDVDEQWALIHIIRPKKEYDQLIRLSSIKGVSEK